MKSIEILYPGLKELLVQNGMSVQAQDRHAIRTAVDQRSEQTVNREAKTTGGVKEKLESFSIGINKDTLVNLSSCVALPQNITDELLAKKSVGSTIAVLFHHKILRNVNKSFTSSKRQIKVKIVQKSIEVNQTLLVSLASFSLKFGKPNDYTLASLVLVMQMVSGESVRRVNLQPPSNSSSTYVVDLMTAVRTLLHIPDTFENLTWKLLKTTPVGYKRIDIVAGTYKRDSLKYSEQSKGEFLQKSS